MCTIAESINAKAANRLIAALEPGDLDAHESLLARDDIERRPQLGRRFVGRMNIMGMYRDIPDLAELSWRLIRGSGDL
jgi:hypothetical protein